MNIRSILLLLFHQARILSGQNCVELQKPCKLDGSLGGWCCSTFCFVPSGQTIGFCTERNCLTDGEQCHQTGSIGFCCSDFCDQGFSDKYGTCGQKTTTNPSTSTENVIETTTSTSDSTQLILGVSIGSLLLTAIIFSVLIIVWVFRKRHKKAATLTKTEFREFLEGLNVSNSQSTTTIDESSRPYTYLTQEIDSRPYDKHYEINEADFTIDHSNTLGSGEFSIVVKGFVRGQPVAAKTIKFGVSDSIYIKALLTELKVLIHIGTHRNIVSLIGANTTKLTSGSCYVFIELCQHGSLENYLRNYKKEFLTFNFNSNNNNQNGSNSYVELQEQNDQQKSQQIIYPSISSFLQLNSNNSRSGQQFNNIITSGQLQKWCLEIATGMAFISDLKVVHGDLATRNVLLGDGLIAKISDFGLSKKLYTYSKYVSSNKDVLLPWRSMAPETLSHLTFSTASDVWSFGISMWEVYSLGEVPYLGHQWSSQFIESLNNKDLRPEKPTDASDEMFEIMSDCWTFDPQQRPSFHELMSRLSAIASPHLNCLYKC